MKKGILILLSLYVFGCGEQATNDPDIMEKEKMAGVLTDIIINEKIIASKGYGLDSAIKMYHRVYQPWLYEKYGFSKEVLEKNLDYYLEDMGKLEEVLTIVQDTLAARSESGRFR